MSVLIEGGHAGEFILTELPGRLSRDTVTVDVPAATTLEAGTVLGQVASSGHYGPYDDANSDGTETATGLLYAELPNTGLDPVEMEGVVVNFGVEVRADDLVWGDGVDEAGGLADLRAVAIKARD